ncbi:mCpol domain-containing protein [Streptomyces sp. NPDC088732]|uniref:mCpol domain-containing protein n=1 Tax=Streptomyces sp. NPDC088732 TaxID=3365879 RepID=UPI0038175C1D
MPFAIIDGDDVGSKVERHLLSNNVSAFTEASRMIADSIEELAEELGKIAGAEVIAVGGDSILTEFRSDAMDELINTLTGLQRPERLTFSAGVGTTLRESFVALRMAKSSGKCRIVAFPEELG